MIPRDFAHQLPDAAQTLPSKTAVGAPYLSDPLLDAPLSDRSRLRGLRILWEPVADRADAWSAADHAAAFDLPVRAADLRRRRRHRDVRSQLGGDGGAPRFDRRAGLHAGRQRVLPWVRGRSIATATTTRGAATKAGRSRCPATTNTCPPGAVPYFEYFGEVAGGPTGRATTASRLATGMRSRSTATFQWAPDHRRSPGSATI